MRDEHREPVRAPAARDRARAQGTPAVRHAPGVPGRSPQLPGADGAHVRRRGALQHPRAVGLPGDRPGRRQTRSPGQRRQLRAQDAQRGRAARDPRQRSAHHHRTVLVAEPAPRAAELSPAAARRVRGRDGRRGRGFRQPPRARPRGRRAVRHRARALAPHPAHPGSLPVRTRSDRRCRRGGRRAEGRPPPHHREAGGVLPAARPGADAQEPALPRGAARAGPGGAVAHRRTPPGWGRPRRPPVDAARGA